ncbi:MAG: quinol monooxygenase YgiN [Crocinitomicaceae bacterium]|jgi:quinol monooxygenase YgiN
MITRIVHLEFQEDRIEEFLAFFDTIKSKVNSFPGCHGMKLYQDVAQPTIILTYSHWETEEALENYRKSKTFGVVWPKIKPWFSEKPHAWTVNAYFDGFSEK